MEFCGRKRALATVALGGLGAVAIGAAPAQAQNAAEVAEVVQLLELAQAPSREMRLSDIIRALVRGSDWEMRAQTGPAPPAPPVARPDAPPPEPKADDRDMQAVFEQILRDPGNAGLNLRYARLAIDRGELRKALGAYERILARDPNNEEAKAGLERVKRALEPTLTRVTLSVGGTFESNPRHDRRPSGNSHDGTLAARLEAFDERRLGDIRWRSVADIYANYHLRFHDIDYGTIGGQTGPVFDVGPGWRVHPFVGTAFAWLRRRYFFVEGTVGATLEADGAEPFRSLTARFGYDAVGAAFSARDAIFFELAGRFVFADLGYPGATGWATPYWRYNGVIGSGAPGIDQRTEPFPARYHQLGARLDYFMPILSELTLGLNFTYEYRHYFENVLNGAFNRRDHLVSPGFQAIVSGIIDPRLDLIFSYNFETRFSNDGLQRFSNHLAGVRVLWRF